MERSRRRRSNNMNLLASWAVAACFCVLLLATSSSATAIPHEMDFPEGGNGPDVRLEILDHVVLDNGLARVSITKPDGVVSEIQYKSMENLLSTQESEDARGYWDIHWSLPNGEGKFDRIESAEFSVIKEDNNQVEISFKRTWEPSNGNDIAPMNIDKRFVMLRGSHGFYSYAIYEHLQGWPDFNLGASRLTLKLNGDKFHYMAISDERQRVMPTAEDRLRGQKLDYPEAILLTNPSNSDLRGEVDDKYQYSCNTKDCPVHGWISDDLSVGLWMITPSNEYRTGGPVKQELTSHVGPSTLAVFISRHYVGEPLDLIFRNGEPWKKVFGPVFIYLNSADKASPNLHTELWSDAKQQMTKEVQSWPYSFPVSSDFPHSDQRGNVTGRLLVHDRFIRDEFIPANSAYVGLARPGPAGSWQTEAKGYQFWTKTDANGFFSVNNVREGDYSLYAWVPGFIGDYKYKFDLKITPGGYINLGNIVYEPPRDGPTLWEIGIPDRSAAEFYIPDPNPRFVNRLYVSHTNIFGKELGSVDKFRQYGLWERYTELYPVQDLVYTVGTSNYSKDWFYAQVTRKNEDNTFRPTTWQVVFNLDRVIHRAIYKLRVALAASTLADLNVQVNQPSSDNKVVLLRTRMIGRDNAIARHGIHGLYWLYYVDIPSNLLVVGNNTLYLNQAIATGPFEGLMYDYLRLEGPSSATTTYFDNSGCMSSFY